MGFFGNSDAVMSGDQFFFMDDDKQKLAVCMAAGARMAPAIGGQVKTRDDGDEVHVTGHYGPYSVRFIIWVSFANLRVQVKTQRSLGLPESVHIKFDDKAAEHAAEQTNRDEWDAGSEQRLFLSHNLVMGGDADELRNMRASWEQLPHEITGGVLSLLSAFPKSGTSFSMRDDQIEVYLNDSTIPLSQTAGQRIAQVTQLLVAVAAAAEQRFGSGAAPQQPGAPAFAQPGPPAPPAAPPAPAFAPGAPVLVTWSDGQRYGATVAQVAPGQYLCLFPNGQQHWVAAQWVNRA